MKKNHHRVKEVVSIIHFTGTVVVMVLERKMAVAMAMVAEVVLVEEVAVGVLEIVTAR